MRATRPGRDFLSRYTPDVARDILGFVIVRNLAGIRLTARIVEVEAYRGPDDPASHAYRGRTGRNAVMFGAAGHAYVYFTYGNHHCLNITTETEGVAGAVLIRAAEPIVGIEEMKRRRGVREIANLMSGPGKLTKALGIDLALNGEDMITSRRLYLLTGRKPKRTGVSTRIGVSKGMETKWRFYEEDSPYVSGARTHNYGDNAGGRRGVVG